MAPQVCASVEVLTTLVTAKSKNVASIMLLNMILEIIHRVYLYPTYITLVLFSVYFLHVAPQVCAGVEVLTTLVTDKSKNVASFMLIIILLFLPLLLHLL